MPTPPAYDLSALIKYAEASQDQHLVDLLQAQVSRAPAPSPAALSAYHRLLSVLNLSSER